MQLTKIKALHFSPNFNFGNVSKSKKTTENDIDIPVFNAGKTIKYKEIVEFHKCLEQNKDRDKISYKFYTTPHDIGSGFFILGLPIARTDESTRAEMLKEVKRLLSSESTLSVDEHKMLRYLYQNEQEIRYFSGESIQQRMFYKDLKLNDNEIYLSLIGTYEAIPEKGWVPLYPLDICLSDGAKVDFCNFKVDNSELTKYCGNIGYGIDEKHQSYCFN